MRTFTVRLFAVLLAMLLFCCPLAQAKEQPPLSMTLRIPDGPVYGLGWGNAATGEPVYYLTFDAPCDHSAEEGIHEADAVKVIATDTTVYLQNGDAVYAASLRELMALLMSSSPSIPTPTEEDLLALLTLLQETLDQLTRQAFSMTLLGGSLVLHADVDRLGDELHTIVPQVLAKHAEIADALLAKYSPYLFGERVTAAQLAEAWPELGLDELDTQLTCQLQARILGGQLMLSCSLGEATLLLTAGNDALAFTFTAPDGTLYEFNSRDFTFIADMLSHALAQITPEAFSCTQEDLSDALGDRVYATTFTLDTAVLAHDLNTGMADYLRTNANVINRLLDKYRTWIALADADLARQLTTDMLVSAFEENLIRLPAVTGKLEIRENLRTRTASFSGYLGNYTLTGSTHNSRDVFGTFTLAHEDRYLPWYSTFSYSYADDALTLTLNSSDMILGLFRTISLSYAEDYDLEWHLTTDTNAIRAGFSGEEQYMELKVGPVNLRFHEDENYVYHLSLYTPEFFADAHFDEENINLDTSLFGFDYTELDDGMTLTGYLFDSLRRFDAASFALTYNDMDELLTAYLEGLEDSGLHLQADADGLTLRLDDEYRLYAEEAERDDQLVYVLAVNGTPAYKLILTDGETVLNATLYAVMDGELVAGPVLELNAQPAPLTLPADAVPVEAEAFLNMLAEAFQ